MVFCASYLAQVWEFKSSMFAEGQDWCQIYSKSAYDARHCLWSFIATVGLTWPTSNYTIIFYVLLYCLLFKIGFQNLMRGYCGSGHIPIAHTVTVTPKQVNCLTKHLFISRHQGLILRSNVAIKFWLHMHCLRQYAVARKLHAIMDHKSQCKVNRAYQDVSSRHLGSAHFLKDINRACRRKKIKNGRNTLSLLHIQQYCENLHDVKGEFKLNTTAVWGGHQSVYLTVCSPVLACP